MLKIYCSDCGSPTEYSLKKPSFCSSCGKSFFKSFSNEKQKLNFRAIEEDEDLNLDQDNNYLPEIDKLDFDVTIEKNPAQKISDLASSAKNNPYREIQSTSNITNASENNILEEFAKEAGAIRPKHRSRKTKNAEQKKSKI